MADLILANLLSPAILCFLLGLGAAWVRSDLAVPEAMGRGLALYLMFAIGFKGGSTIAVHGLSRDAQVAAILGLGLSLALPFLAFAWFRVVARLDRLNAGAIAAHYGSVSLVTFVSAKAFLETQGIVSDGAMVAVMALMEMPAIVIGLLLARSTGAGLLSGSLLREIGTNGSIVVLLGSFAIGFAGGERGATQLAPFTQGIFPGILCLFLLDMGLLTLRQSRSAGRLGFRLLAGGIVLPLAAAAIALALAAPMGLGTGDTMLLMTLAASASYIAVPAALRVALPEADLSLSLSLALAITFPFNVTVGLPLYLDLAARATLGAP